jgi:large conductance mechanosensitive channel
MSVVKEFKEFISKGNVLDLAVGIVIGAAFGKIVSSFVDDILMPPIGLMIGGVDFKDLKITLRDSATDAAGVCTNPAVTLNYGNFIQALADFLIIAFAVFLVVKGFNKLRRSQKAAQEVEVIEAPAKEITLLTEIRDLLKK